ncbi:hypothetical protein KM043_018772 [Ampulex compressa]|nr:hypothetical protein KM043_018772 [Ampulex compressa]
MFLVKYISFYSCAPGMITIINRMKDDWLMLKCEGEIRIIEKYMLLGRFLSKLATDDPPNAPRRYKMPFVDLSFKEKHYYVVLICWGTHALFGAVTLLATETSMLLFTQHTCGVFGIACYRMRNAFEEENKLVPQFKNNLLVCDRLIGAITIYQRAIDLAEQITFTFASSYIMLLSIGVASLSVNLFRLSRQFLTGNGWEEFLTSLLLIICHLSYMFFGNCVAQQINNHSCNMFVETYDTTWYKASLPAAKLLLMIMQRTVKSYTFAVSGVFVGSLEGFSKLLSLSLSYFAFMYNTQ